MIFREEIYEVIGGRNWELLSLIIPHGVPPSQPGDWMIEGLKYRDRWESKLLRTDSWSRLK